MRAIIKKAYQAELDVKPSFEAFSVLSEGGCGTLSSHPLLFQQPICLSLIMSLFK